MHLMFGAGSPHSAPLTVALIDQSPRRLLWPWLPPVGVIVIMGHGLYYVHSPRVGAVHIYEGQAYIRINFSSFPHESLTSSSASIQSSNHVTGAQFPSLQDDGGRRLHAN